LQIKIYEVGGSVRDRILGLSPKDFDYSVEAPSYQDMSDYIKRTHDKVFLEKPEFATIRAKKGSDTFDYVMCRKDGHYSDGRHPDFILPGTIYDDLARRDFTANAMAVDSDTNHLIDPHGGLEDARNKILRCVGSGRERLLEDPLRVIRAVRFCITKGFNPDENISEVFMDASWPDKIVKTVSSERIREELHKCFYFNSAKTMSFLINSMSKEYSELIFGENKDGAKNLWLEPTSKRK